MPAFAQVRGASSVHRSPWSSSAVARCLHTRCIPRSEEVTAVGWALKRIRSGKPRYTAAYRDDGGRLRSAGTFDSAREAVDAARRQEMKIGGGTWIDPAAGRITFAEYALEAWLPSRLLEVSTRAGYLSILRTHFVPYFEPMPLAKIKPSTVQGWVSHAVEVGLSPCLLYTSDAA